MDPITIRRPAHPGQASTPARAAVRAVPARARHGRPVILAARTLAALALADAALRSGAGPGPAAATLAGVTAWYLRTVPADLAPLPAANHDRPAGAPLDRDVPAGARRRPPIVADGQRVSRPFVLASLRALRLDTRHCPPAKTRRLSRRRTNPRHNPKPGTKNKPPTRQNTSSAGEAARQPANSCTGSTPIPGINPQPLKE